VKTLQRLAVALNEHTGMEERLVLQVVERHVFASEWQVMEEHAATHIEPEVAPLVVGMVMYEAEPEAVPQDMLAIFGEMGPKVYAAHCELVHGTPTPPRTTDVVIGTPYVGVAAGVGARCKAPIPATAKHFAGARLAECEAGASCAAQGPPGGRATTGGSGAAGT
jgi:hypothetical protein